MSKILKNVKKETKSELMGISILTVGLLSLVSLFATKSGDFSAAFDGPGAVGSFIVRVLEGLTGAGKYFLPIILVVWGIHNIRFIKIKTASHKIFSLAILFLVFLTVIHFQEPMENWSFQAGLLGYGGGVIGAILLLTLVNLFGVNGSYIILIGSATAALILLTEYSLSKFIKKNLDKLKLFLQNAKEKLINFIYVTVDEEDRIETNNKRKEEILINDVEDINYLDNIDEETNIKVESESSLEKALEKVEPEIIREQEFEKDSHEINEKENMQQEKGFLLPPVELLQKNLKIKANRLNKDITDKVKILEQTLVNFGVQVKVTQVNVGPVITRYEMQPAPGIKVSKIVNLADDLSLSLAAPSVRIEAPIPGKAAIGIEVPNKEIATVQFREVLDSPSFHQKNSNLPIALGKGIAGQPIIGDLASMPHLLVAGATGSGKSVCMNTIITSLLYRMKPNEMKMLMIDPKKVELTTYNGIPHLISPVITDAKKAASSLKWIVEEMENRYEMFAAAGAKDILRYNKLMEENGNNEGFLPYIVVLIDELSDLMMAAPVDVEDAICRIAQMARAAGIHLVIATQRPSVDVITGLIKANIPSRIAFAVSSQTDSRTILDMGGAEKLLGKGDMLYYPAGANKPIRVQGGYLSDKEVEKVVSFLKDQLQPEYEQGVVDKSVNVTTVENKDEQDADPLVKEAAILLVEHGQASISMLQRKFRIGYARAARLIDLMEEYGIVGGYEGSKPRNILVSKEELNHLLEMKNINMDERQDDIS